MTSAIVKSTIIFLASVLLFACSDEKPPREVNDTTTGIFTDVSPSNDLPLDEDVPQVEADYTCKDVYTSEMKAVFTENCVSCHVSRGLPSLDSYEVVSTKARLETIYHRIAVTKQTPTDAIVNGVDTFSERDAMSEWALNCINSFD